MRNARFALAALLLLGAACQRPPQQAATTNQANTVLPSAQNQNAAVSSTVSWSFNGSAWSANGTPPACPNPLVFPSPVDASLATAILYPGQTRGGNYKPHGGFNFRGKQNGDITVTAPLDAVVYNAARYIEAGETQYLLTFIHPCGLAYRFDHLLTLSPAMQAVADTLPAAQENNSATQFITTGVSVKAGDAIATAVGFKVSANVGVDFGVYDLRQKNAAAADPAWASSHNPEQAHYAICWLENLSGGDSAVAKALPGGDGLMGKTSDYCS